MKKNYKEIAKTLRKFIKESSVDLNSMLMKYDNEFFLDGQNKKEIFSEVIKGNPSKKTIDYLDSRLNAKQFNYMRDDRTPAEYGEDLVLAWLKEDLCFFALEEMGFKVSLQGVDREREFLKAKEVKSNADLLIELNGISRKVELMYDANMFWKKKNACDLRGDKFNKIKEEKGIILGISIADREAFCLDLADKNVIYSHPIKFIPFHFFYKKPAYNITNIRNVLGPWEKKLEDLKSMMRQAEELTI